MSSKLSYISLFILGTGLYIVIFVVSWSPFSSPNAKKIPLRLYDEDNHEKSTRNNTLHEDEDICPFPSVDPFDSAVMQYIFTHPTVDCTLDASAPSLVYLYKDKFLRVNKLKAIRLSIKFESCRYTQLKMVNGSDYGIQPYNWSSWFDEIIHLNDDDEYLYVKCYHKERVVSRSFVSRFVKKPKVEERAYLAYREHLKTSKPLETLNILMVGIDGMSKQAFQRSMPKTRNFLLNELHARELHKFNKIGLNTFPNVIALLTGKHAEELSDQWSYDEYFDKIDHLFVWDEYKKAGYRTAFMTDVVWLTMFHYSKMGWKKPPFDYFFRPIPATLYPEKEAGTMRKNCIGDTPELTLLLNYWLQLTSNLNKTIHKGHPRPVTPYFAYSFFTRLSHDFASLSNKGDELYMSFFQELKRMGTLQNTVLIVFSDHGGRFGKVREMYQGMLESRMPFFMFVFPKWFQEKYPEVMDKFTTNQNRLTTMFDIHATLQDLLNFSGPIKVENESTKKQRGISLFREIPISRNCKDAGIPLKYCLCTRVQSTKISDTTRTILVFTLYRHISSLTLMRREICEQLRLKSIASVLPVESESSERARSFYQVTIVTFPGDAMFEAILSYDSDQYSAQVEGDVVRLNMYKGQDGCMQELSLKPFCYCKKG